MSKRRPKHKVRIVSKSEVWAITKGYEEKFGMTTAEFVTRWKKDQVVDTYETNLWISLVRAVLPSLLDIKKD